MQKSETGVVHVDRLMEQKEKEIATQLQRLEEQVRVREERIQQLHSEMQKRIEEAQQIQKTLIIRIGDLEESIRQQKASFALSSTTIHQLTNEKEEWMRHYDEISKEKNELAKQLEEQRRKLGDASPNFVVDGVRRLSRLLSLDGSNLPSALHPSSATHEEDVEHSLS